MADGDELFSLRNAYYLGNYTEALQEAQAARVSGDLKVERDVFVYRSHIMSGNYNIAIEELDSPSLPVSLQILYTLALYLDPENSENKQKVLESISSLQSQSKFANDSTVQTILATIYFKEGNTSAALRVLKDQSTLEQLAICTQIYLSIHRVDLALLSVQKMVALDDESILTQLTSATVNFVQGGEKMKEASFLYKDLLDRYGPCSCINNGLALVYMSLKRYEDAERLLMEIYQKNSNDSDTISNLITLYSQTNKHSEAMKLVSKLRQVSNDQHPLIDSLTQVEQAFNTIKNQFSA
jgi:coatomer subunit epsilon